MSWRSSRPRARRASRSGGTSRSRRPTRSIRSLGASTSRSSRRPELTSTASAGPASTPGFADDGPAGPRPDYADDYYAAFSKTPPATASKPSTATVERPSGNIDHVAIRVNDVEASTAFYSTIGRRRRTDDPAPDRRPRHVLSSANQTAPSSSSPESRPRTSTSPSRATTTTCAGSTPTRSRPATAATASRVSARATTPATTPRTCSTPTATTSKSSTTIASTKQALPSACDDDSRADRAAARDPDRPS